MGKIWGYPYRDPSGMLCKQTIGKGRRNRKVIMKLPNLYDMQRMVLTKHLARLHQYPVYCAKMVDLDFEEKVDEFRKYSTTSFARGTKGKVRKEREAETVGNEEFNLERMKHQYFTIGKTSADEKWQRIHWRKAFFRDKHSDVMNEIYAMNRMVTQNWQSFGKAYQAKYVILLETCHYALKVHDWPRLAFALGPMLKYTAARRDFRVGASGFVGNTVVLWMYGFLALINYYKENVEIVKQYSRCLKDIILQFPLPIGIQIATWLIQKGYFLEGYEILMEHVELWQNRHSRYKFVSKLTLQNVKRKQIILVADYVKAVWLYSEWKREKTLLLEHEEDESDDWEPLRVSAGRKAESALTAFEQLYEKQKDVKCDVMCFIEPLVELLIECRSVDRALEVVEAINVENDGNLVVEEYFVNFIEKHASDCDLSENYVVQNKERWLAKTSYDQRGDPLERLKARRRVKGLRAAKKKTGIVSTFKQIENPAFSV